MLRETRYDHLQTISQLQLCHKQAESAVDTNLMLQVGLELDN